MITRFKLRQRKRNGTDNGDRHEAKGKRGVSERKVSYRWKRSEVR